MGTYNSIVFPCPYCNGRYEHQSKSGDCRMAKTSLMNASAADKVDSIGIHKCGHCGRRFTVEAQVIASVLPFIMDGEDGRVYLEDDHNDFKVME